MKKSISLLLLVVCIIAALTACAADPEPSATTESTAAPTAPPTTTPPATTPSNVFTIGNLRINLESDQTFTKHDESSYTVDIVPEKATLFIYASDVSSFGLDAANTISDIQLDTLTEDRVKLGVSKTDLKIAGFDVVAEAYASIDSDGNVIACMDTGFTDTWYAYSFIFCCNGQDDNVSDYSYALGNLIRGIKYTGSAPRGAGTAETKPDSSQHTYVLNTSTMKFHLQSCSSADEIKSYNKDSFTGTREDLISRGYSPCGKCHP